MLATINSGIEAALIGGGIAVGLALFGAMYKIGVQIGNVATGIESLDSKLDGAIIDVKHDVAELDMRVTRLEDRPVTPFFTGGGRS